MSNNTPAQQDTGKEMAEVDRGLAIDPSQNNFTGDQQAALRQLGIDGASDGDLAIFFRHCQRTGLDPFRKQIYMIGRPTKNQRTGKWETRWTIQTGIDGYRKITARTASLKGDDMTIGTKQWCGEDGQWRDIWPAKWGKPEAARASVTVGGRTYTATAMFDEYVQTTKDGEPNSMWRKMPANQIAKCAEAAAHRMATPDDLAGINIDDEMPTAVRVESERVVQPGKGRDAARAALGISEPASQTELEPDTSQDTAPEPAPEPEAEHTVDVASAEKVEDLRRELEAANIAPAERQAYLSGLIGRQLGSLKEMTTREVDDAIEFTTTGELPVRD